jgi:hypothetical protein
MAAAGHTLTQIAASTNLATRQRVQRLITMAKAAEEAALAVQAASREFHERLAAVEATLDEVVSGIVPIAPAPVEESTDESVQFVEAADEPAARHRAEDRVEYDLAAFDEIELDPDAMFEPTMAMPALRPLLQPTKEMPPSEENAPWWRRRNGTGAA